MDSLQNNLKRSGCSVHKLCSAGKHHGLLGDKAAFFFLITNLHYASISAKREEYTDVGVKRLINSACKWMFLKKWLMWTGSWRMHRNLLGKREVRGHFQAEAKCAGRCGHTQHDGELWALQYAIMNWVGEIEVVRWQQSSHEKAWTLCSWYYGSIKNYLSQRIP